MRSIVGVVGFIGSGKGTVADMLEKDFGYLKYSFANPVKDAAAAIFGWSRTLLEGDTEESRKFRETADPFWSEVLGKEFTPRLALQLMGTEAGRQVFGDDLWVGAAKRRLLSVKDDKWDIVIPDVRFRNEIEMIREAGGMIVHVERGVRPIWWDMASSANNGNGAAYLEMKTYSGIHESEWAWIGVGHPEVTIKNDGTLDDLYAKMKILFMTKHYRDTHEAV